MNGGCRCSPIGFALVALFRAQRELLRSACAMQDLSTQLYSNPHSGHIAWCGDASASDAETQARTLTLKMCNASEQEYECIFVSGATGTPLWQDKAYLQSQKAKTYLISLKIMYNSEPIWPYLSPWQLLRSKSCSVCGRRYEACCRILSLVIRQPLFVHAGQSQQRCGHARARPQCWSQCCCRGLCSWHLRR